MAPPWTFAGGLLSWLVAALEACYCPDPIPGQRPAIPVEPLAWTREGRSPGMSRAAPRFSWWWGSPPQPIPRAATMWRSHRHTGPFYVWHGRSTVLAVLKLRRFRSAVPLLLREPHQRGYGPGLSHPVQRFHRRPLTPGVGALCSRSVLASTAGLSMTPYGTQTFRGSAWRIGLGIGPFSSCGLSLEVGSVFNLRYC